VIIATSSCFLWKITLDPEIELSTQHNYLDYLRDKYQ